MKFLGLLMCTAAFALSACNKMEERQDTSLRVTKVGSTTYTTTQPTIIDCQSGETLLVEYQYNSSFPIAEMKYGTDYEEDQSQYLLQQVADGASSGTIQFNFVVNDLIPEPVAGGIPQYKTLRFEILNDEGVTAEYAISFRKVN